MEIRLTLGRKNLLLDFSSRKTKSFFRNELSAFFKEITPTISWKNISLISILQDPRQGPTLPVRAARAGAAAQALVGEGRRV